MTTQPWVSAHLFYFDNHNALLVGLVRPLVCEATDAGLSTGAFYLRYWDGGPHIRLRMKAAHPGDADELATLTSERALAFFARHPSRKELSQEDYLAEATRIAAWEGTGYQRQLGGNNTLRFQPYVAETNRYGTGRTLEAVERHFVESSGLALELLQRSIPAEQRDLIAATCLLVTQSMVAGATGEPCTHPLQSSFLRRYDENWVKYQDASYAAQRPVLQVAMQDAELAVRPAEADEAPRDFYKIWARSLGRLHRILTEEQRAWRFQESATTHTPGATAQPGADPTTRVLDPMPRSLSRSCR